jgi:hypothetical protein
VSNASQKVIQIDHTQFLGGCHCSIV